MLEKLELEVFESLVGERFTLTGEGVAPVEVVLSAVEPTPYGDPATYAGRKMPFSLLFRSPEGTLIPQQTCTLAHASAGETPLFVVPLGPDAGGMRYEAVIS